ncbi:MAG: hypothetical protein IT522_03735 [Burkholderiales bacterium]|nr:hypothetical protein [Burkholderiales bacterium]
MSAAGPRRSRESRWLAALPLAAAIAAGTWLRGQQWADQVLIDDEWHLVHRLVLASPREMFLDFGYADYGIPLGLFYALLGRLTSLSEAALRLPMLVAGVATLVVLPALVVRRVGLATTTIFAWLLAISPLLIVYSRLARPYALVLLLVWCAVFALFRFAARDGRGLPLGGLIVVTSTLAVWLHLPAAGFVAGAFAFAALRVGGRTEPAARRVRWRLAGLALVTAAIIAALVVPPLVAHPQAMVLKSGVDAPTGDTIVGLWFAWTGTGSAWVAGLAAILATAGARPAMRGVPELRALALGTLLVVLLVVLTRPASSHYGIVLARYLLPALPMALLAVASGAMVIVRRGAARAPRIVPQVAGALGAAAIALLVATSPVREWWERPNRQALHMQYYFDFRADRNPYAAHLAVIPDSPYWRSLARYPPGSLRIAVAPFHFESFEWNAPKWERESGQTVIPAYLSGLCVDWRWGEVPDGRHFTFRNAVRLADVRDVAAKEVDFVVWQKPYRRGTDFIGEETRHCAVALRARFGDPVFEDAALLVFAAKPAASRRPP